MLGSDDSRALIYYKWNKVQLNWIRFIHDYTPLNVYHHGKHHYNFTSEAYTFCSTVHVHRGYSQSYAHHFNGIYGRKKWETITIKHFYIDAFCYKTDLGETDDREGEGLRRMEKAYSDRDR